MTAEAILVQRRSADCYQRHTHSLPFSRDCVAALEVVSCRRYDDRYANALCDVPFYSINKILEAVRRLSVTACLALYALAVCKTVPADIGDSLAAAVM